MAGQLNGEENALALRQALNAALAIGDKKWRARALVSLSLHLDKTNALLRTLDCLHWLEDTGRADFLAISSKLLPNLALQPGTNESIAGYLIDICSTWKWL